MCLLRDGKKQVPLRTQRICTDKLANTWVPNAIHYLIRINSECVCGKFLFKRIRGFQAPHSRPTIKGPTVRQGRLRASLRVPHEILGKGQVHLRTHHPCLHLIGRITPRNHQQAQKETQPQRRQVTIGALSCFLELISNLPCCFPFQPPTTSLLGLLFPSSCLGLTS